MVPPFFGGGVGGISDTSFMKNQREKIFARTSLSYFFKSDKLNGWLFEESGTSFANQLQKVVNRSKHEITFDNWKPPYKVATGKYASKRSFDRAYGYVYTCITCAS